MALISSAFSPPDGSVSSKKAFQDAQEFEFIVENGELFMLQTRTARRNALASLRMAAEMLESGLINPEEALERLSSIAIDSIAIHHVKPSRQPLGQTISAGTGVAHGPGD
jgi:pyruvate,orthophosphate dikinase